MDANVKQHEAFHAGLHKWGEYLASLAADASKFEAREMIALMDAFIPSLNTHLNDEIPTLLALGEFGDTLDLKGIVEKEAEQVIGGLSKTTQLPVFLLNHDVSFEGGIHDFPPIPPPVRWVLMRVFPMVHTNWWKFASCDYAGMPKALHRPGAEGVESGQY
jgi:hypothetical protein